ncbi:Xaa-Pro aminopeptidase [Thalassoporum mexicanum PCC 7367]|uniref:aminopeptidase P family protein n=1 Tax=Thalassoporum mexicanum TaxID=3457544 RepID=UPI00029F9DBC|nr:aminopeptidase P family protein [Pseudanabaena sp. PCC 7367]AFY69596.1 Xaa-Pro aminopeptidase [Pseudanabaena sp. PCC 7367]
MQLKATIQQRRQKLADRFNGSVVLWSGSRTARNFPANVYPFRASSHFLYFAGLPLEQAAIRLDGGKLELFMDDSNATAELWHGKTPSRAQIAESIGADAAYPMSELAAKLNGNSLQTATLPVQDKATLAQQQQLLQRTISSQALIKPGENEATIDRTLALAIVELRLCHDQGAISELKKAASVTIEAHKAGMTAAKSAKREADIRAAIEQVIMANNMTCAYQSIVTVHGEVLHNEHYHHPVSPGDLLLADVGAETELGWAADVTRTFPVSGKFSASQRAIYEVVLAAHDACIDRLAPGVEYRDIHLTAARILAEGLVDLGILKGKPDDLVDLDAHALFFPHGVGHILGLDVHDMEDLGDLAGYEVGRTRSDRFGLGYLRLDRPLRAGMLVTIEPGFYQVPAILENQDWREKYQDLVDWQRLADFADVRGIRIEDDVLITDSGCEVLTSALPTKPEAIEELVTG